VSKNGENSVAATTVNEKM